MAINLKKGNQINLTKSNGQRIEFVSVGLNWGKIQKKALFGLINSGKDDVDLDGSAAMFDDRKELIEVVYYKHLRSNDKAIRHSGDDLRGDDKDDNKDNEVITIDFQQVSPRVKNIVLFLNSYKGQDFASIPYSRIRIYEGASEAVKSLYASFDLSADPQFAGNVSMILGKFYRTDEGWRFMAIGEPVAAPRIDGTIEIIRDRFV